MTDHETNRPDSKGGADTPPKEPDPPARPIQKEIVNYGERPNSSGHDIIIERR